MGVLLRFCVTDDIALKAHIDILPVRHLRPVSIEAHKELLIAALNAVCVHFLGRLILNHNDCRRVTGDLRAVGELACRRCLCGSYAADVQFPADAVLD